jgi:hypothetical protein
MNESKTVDPADIPPSGKRQDMTLTKVGVNHKGEGKARQLFIIRAIIDNGEYSGKNVSLGVEYSPQNVLNVFDRLGWGALTRQGEPMEWIERAQIKHARTFRFSAVVGWREVEEEDGRKVYYTLSGFESPSEEAELTLREKPTQFERVLDDE